MLLCRILYNVGAIEILGVLHCEFICSYNPPGSSYGSSSYNAGGTGYYSGSNPILYPGYVDDVQLLIRKVVLL